MTHTPERIGAFIGAKRFEGGYLIWRRTPRAFKKKLRLGCGPLPRWRHPTFESAEAEAKRLTELHPDSTFVIVQEVATVKYRTPEQIAEAA